MTDKEMAQHWKLLDQVEFYEMAIAMDKNPINQWDNRRSLKAAQEALKAFEAPIRKKDTNR